MGVPIFCVNGYSHILFRAYIPGTKKPALGGLLMSGCRFAVLHIMALDAPESPQLSSPRIHRPPKDMTQDRNLLLLNLSERVVLVRMLVTVEAA